MSVVGRDKVHVSTHSVRFQSLFSVVDVLRITFVQFSKCDVLLQLIALILVYMFIVCSAVWELICFFVPNRNGNNFSEVKTIKLAFVHIVKFTDNSFFINTDTFVGSQDRIRTYAFVSLLSTL